MCRAVGVIRRRHRNRVLPASGEKLTRIEALRASNGGDTSTQWFPRRSPGGAADAARRVCAPRGDGSLFHFDSASNLQCRSDGSGMLFDVMVHALTKPVRDYAHPGFSC